MSRGEIGRHKGLKSPGIEKFISKLRKQNLQNIKLERGRSVARCPELLNLIFKS